MLKDAKCCGNCIYLIENDWNDPWEDDYYPISYNCSHPDMKDFCIEPCKICENYENGIIEEENPVVSEEILGEICSQTENCFNCKARWNCSALNKRYFKEEK